MLYICIQSKRINMTPDEIRAQLSDALFDLESSLHQPYNQVKFTEDFNRIDEMANALVLAELGFEIIEKIPA